MGTLSVIQISITAGRRSVNRLGLRVDVPGKELTCKSDDGRELALGVRDLIFRATSRNATVTAEIAELAERIDHSCTTSV